MQAQAFQLNPRQHEAATWRGGHLLVLAGAGTGKTRTLIARAAHLIKQGADPRGIACITFTRNAAREIKDRLMDEVGAQAKDVFAGTFHKWAITWIRRNPRVFELNEYQIMDAGDMVHVMGQARGKVIDRLEVRTGQKQQAKDFPKPKDILNWHSFARNTSQLTQDYLEKFTPLEGPMMQFVQDVVEAYEAQKQRLRRLDYDDLLHKFQETLWTDASFRAKVMDHHSNLLVDEVQDTNAVQFLAIMALQEEVNVWAVGDDAQSIYAFRGADYKNVHSFTERIPNSTVVKLEENYRSTQNILDLSNHILEQSPLDYDKKLYAFDGRTGIRPVLETYHNPFAEAEAVFGHIQEYLDDGADPTELMILFRTSADARLLEGKLSQAKIPYRFLGGTSLLETAHVKDVLSAMKCCVSLSDELAWHRYLTTWHRVGDVKAVKVQQVLNSPFVDSEDHALEQAAKFDEEYVAPAIEVVQLARRGGRTPAQLLRDLIANLSDTMAERYSDWERREKDFEGLLKSAESYTDVAQFVEDFTLDPVSKATAQNPDGVVTLITVHQAKGTEADFCIIMGAGPDRFPHSRSTSEEEIEEERRILYVAATRARKRLVITRSEPQAAWFNQSGDEDEEEREYFLEDIPEHLLAQW